MKDIFYKLWKFSLRVGSLRRIMRTKDALYLAYFEDKFREVEIYLTPIKRNVVLRCGTSDISCLIQVFVDNEYKTPYEVDPKVIIDAGANIGSATLFFSNLYPNAKIFSIEPEASNFSILKKNCAGLPNVTLMNAALWPNEKTLVIRDSAAEKWAFSVVEGANLTGSESVKAVTIPMLLGRSANGSIDILKLDIEGAERELFNSGAESWLGKVDQIIIELHDKYNPGSACAFYSKITRQPFVQEIRGENIFVKFKSLE